jgi:hypothetical protein
VARYEVPKPPPIDPGRLADVVPKSPNAESIVKDDEGQFDCKPIDVVNPDVFAMALRATRNCADDMRKLVKRGNSYYALDEVTDIIERELERSSEAPLLIYQSICAVPFEQSRRSVQPTGR